MNKYLILIPVEKKPKARKTHTEWRLHKKPPKLFVTKLLYFLFPKLFKTSTFGRRLSTSERYLLSDLLCIVILSFIIFYYPKILLLTYLLIIISLLLFCQFGVRFHYVRLKVTREGFHQCTRESTSRRVSLVIRFIFDISSLCITAISGSRSQVRVTSLCFIGWAK